MWSIDHDLKTYIPEDKSEFYITLNLSLGSSKTDGADYFDLFVCSPEWLCKHQWEPEILRNTLIVQNYDLDEITETINKYKGVPVKHGKKQLKSYRGILHGNLKIILSKNQYHTLS